MAFLLLLTACGGSGDSSPRTDQARATVLVYVVGSNLEGDYDMASGNLEEMAEVGSSSDVNIIVETGGADKDDWRTVQRHKVVKGDLETLDDVGVQRMTDPAALQDFIEWGVAKYPAQSYHLVLWDHGGGPLGGFGEDSNFPDTGAMSLPEIVEALDGAKRATGVTFDLIGFDACLMASAEIAYMLSPYAHYLVASQDIEPGPGWDWTAYLDHVVNDRNSTVQSTGKVIIDSYTAKMADMGANSTTLSLTDLSKVGALMARVDSLASTIADKLSTGPSSQQFDAWADLAWTRRQSHDFQTSWLFGRPYDLVDLESFLHPALSGLDVTDEQREAVQQALDEAVVYRRHGSAIWEPGGLTVYLPLVGVKQPYRDVFAQRHAALDVPDSLKTVVKRYMDLASHNNLPKPSLGTLTITGDIAQARLINPNFAALEYANLWKTTSGAAPQHLAIKPRDADPTIGTMHLAASPDEDDNDVYMAAHVNEGWFRLPSDDGSAVAVSVLPDDAPRMAAGYAMYTVPVYAVGPEDSGLEGVLMVEYNKDDFTHAETYRVVGFLASNETSPLASRPDPSILKRGQKFHPLVLVSDGDDGYEWEPDRSRTIIGLDAGDEDTPQDQWWQLEVVTADKLCGSDCGFSFGVVDYQGNMNHSLAQ